MLSKPKLSIKNMYEGANFKYGVGDRETELIINE